ncbi:MOSC domain-containing protein [Aridibaculum aurantiacum]|uniref:MOSC domain-containing protein n=1 Tax=Aridibaculum aurantiacum TaxID=2810307 RepID=UPI001F601B87|nr:MOSC N-terminal beta barrel domain-containing protein [Aridibaculum aurantiacum]
MFLLHYIWLLYLHRLYLYQMLTVSEIFIYPIKSLGGVSVTSAQVTDRGFMHDRRWMLVDEENVFMSQRSFSTMALLQVQLKDDGLQVFHKKTEESIFIPYEPTGSQLRVEVWSDKCKAMEVSTEVSEWFSIMLSRKCRLVYMPDASRRRVDSRYATNKEITSFSDAYPFNVVGQSSLDHLNSRLKEPVSIDRFRPNLVITGGAPFEEDEWKHFTINNISFFGVKLCARCVVTTINQQEAIQGKEPLTTLASYRQFQKKIYFGQNLVHDGEGLVQVGDQVQLQERKKARFTLPK